MGRIFYVFLLALLVFGSGCLSQTETTASANGNIETSAPPQSAAPERPMATTTAPSEPIIEKEPVNSADIEYAVYLSEKYATCLKCHGDVRRFHLVPIVSLIDERNGVTARICIVCHGQKVHDIHWELLEVDYIVCKTCHDRGGEFVKPQAKEGMLLVCELCHSGGNYIKIHIEGRILEGAPINAEWKRAGTKHECDTCHIGEYGTIHYNPLSSWNDKIDGAIEESAEGPITPLNISYM